MKFPKIIFYLLFFQATYFLLTAVWPLAHIESFIWITGYKYDVWLVKTVAVLVLNSSMCFFLTLVLKEQSVPVFLLSFISCIGFLFVDVYYALNSVIDKVYLVDGLLQLMLLVVWLTQFNYVISLIRKSGSGARIK